MINFLYANEDATTLIMCGREGIEWNPTAYDEDGNLTQIQFTNPDMSKLDYHQYYGVYGSQLDWVAKYPFTRDEMEKKKAVDANLPADHIFVGNGYIFDGSQLSAEVAAVETVLAQYCKIVNCGAADPADVLPEFIDAMKAAGIDTIIAENQRQLDEYLASK